jgi:hypothetical protein
MPDAAGGRRRPVAIEAGIMAIGVILEVPGGNQQQYDQIMKDLDLKGKLPDGGLCHFAGPMDGGWRVVDVWESKEAFERF